MDLAKIKAAFIQSRAFLRRFSLLQGNTERMREQNVKTTTHLEGLSKEGLSHYLLPFHVFRVGPRACHHT